MPVAFDIPADEESGPTVTCLSCFDGRCMPKELNNLMDIKRSALTRAREYLQSRQGEYAKESSNEIYALAHKQERAYDGTRHSKLLTIIINRIIFVN